MLMNFLKLFYLLAAIVLLPAAMGIDNGFQRRSFWLLDPTLSASQLENHVATLKNTGVDTVILGGGDHHYLFNQTDAALNAYLRTAEKIVTLCHQNGIKVIEHHSNVLISPENCTEALAPMLLMGFSSDGQSGIWPEYGTRSFCPNNPEYRELYWQKLRYILDQVDFDGIMSDDASFHAGCACKICQEKWRKENGGDIFSAFAAGSNTGTKEWILWHATRKRWMRDFHCWLDGRIKAEYPELIHYKLANDSTSPWPSQISGLYPELYAETGDIIVWEIYNPADFYSFRRLSSSAAVYRELCELDNIPASRFTLLPYADTADHRDIFDREEETFMWAFSICVGGDFTFARVFLTGITPTDQPEKFFRFEQQFLPDRAGWGKTFADVGILFSADSRDIDPQWENIHSASYHAWAQVLQDHGIPYRAVTQKTLEGDLNLRLLIIPDVFAISADDLARVYRFVESGGKILLSGNNFLCLPDGRTLDGESEFALNSLKIEPFALPLNPESERRGKGEIFTLKKSIPRELFQNQINEGSAWLPVSKPEIAAACADLVKELASPRITISSANGKLPLFRIYRNADGNISIPMVNTLGAELPSGEAVPQPSRVIWGQPVKITVHTAEPIKSAALLSYPDGTVTELPVSDPRNLELLSPEKFHILTLKF